MSESLENIRILRKSRGLVGTVLLPADKSIAHRAALFSALSIGTSHIVGYPTSEDPKSTLSCLRQLGIQIASDEVGLSVVGKGLNGLVSPENALDCGNSGTTMRLLSGILAGQSFSSVLKGDYSLSSRPMGRIIDPLRMMGALIESNGGRAPLRIEGSQNLRAVEYELPVASAQVKSCVLLAGLFSKGITTVIENTPTRDHTERMLGLSSVTIGSKKYISVQGGQQKPAQMWSIPGDFSAAAFFLVAGSIVPNSALHLPRVGLNPTRTGLIDILRAMGADISIRNERIVAGEPIADLDVRSSELTGITIGGEIIANIIDEIPILAVAASVAAGETIIQDAAELRFKETDRISAMMNGLTTLGARIEEREDGLVISGGSSLTGGTVESFNDHRIAMAMGVAGLMASGDVRVEGANAAAVSFPTFWDVLQELG
jgi:3-phosphoshikimate 1-carboxyvinyltransferase